PGGRDRTEGQPRPTGFGDGPDAFRSRWASSSRSQPEAAWRPTAAHAGPAVSTRRWFPSIPGYSSTVRLTGTRDASALGSAPLLLQAPTSRCYRSQLPATRHAPLVIQKISRTSSPAD